MRAVVQRVKSSKVVVKNKIVGEIGKGYAVLLGVEKDDTIEDAVYISEKLLNLRIFEDENDKLNLSVKDVEGSMLIVSQFTLFGDVRKGRRPSFINAARPEEANFLYDKVCDLVLESVPVERGIFRADMEFTIVNDGPVTILIDSKKNF